MEVIFKNVQFFSFSEFVEENAVYTIHKQRYSMWNILFGVCDHTDKFHKWKVKIFRTLFNVQT